MDLESPKIGKRLPKYLSCEEVDRLLNTSLKTHYDYRNKAIIELMYACGLRASELVDLRIQNIDFVSDVVRTKREIASPFFTA